MLEKYLSFLRGVGAARETVDRFGEGGRRVPETGLGIAHEVLPTLDTVRRIMRKVLPKLETVLGIMHEVVPELEAVVGSSFMAA